MAARVLTACLCSACLCSQIHPMRALFQIPKNPAPKLQDTEKWFVCELPQWWWW
jgi:hypothetical protein